MYETEQRKPSIENLEALADFFNVNMNFLVGHVDTGEKSEVFRKNLATLTSSCDHSDLAAAGIDPFDLDLILNGAISLSLDCACQLSNQLGVSLDYMLEIEQPAIGKDSGLEEIIKVFTALSVDNRSKLLELSRLYLSAQRNSE